MSFTMPYRTSSMESSAPALIWAPARLPRLTAVRVPPDLQNQEIGPVTYRRLLQDRVWGMVQAVSETEARRAILSLVPALEPVLGEAPQGMMAELMFDQSEEVTDGPLAELLAQVAFPLHPTAAPPLVARQVEATGLRAWLRLAVPPET